MQNRTEQNKTGKYKQNKNIEQNRIKQGNRKKKGIEQNKIEQENRKNQCIEQNRAEQKE